MVSKLIFVEIFVDFPIKVCSVLKMLGSDEPVEEPLDPPWKLTSDANNFSQLYTYISRSGSRERTSYIVTEAITRSSKFLYPFAE